jgi:hypothetical protein
MEIDLAKLRDVLTASLDHIIALRGTTKVPIDGVRDFYWDIAENALSDMSTHPAADVGRLSDDADFVALAAAGLALGEVPVPYVLVHAAPLVRYIAERHAAQGL